MKKNNNLDVNNIDNMKFVSELLYKHDCVIIPGFGGFISDYSPARFNKLNNSVTPPTKQIMFNSQLNKNDGLLANYITISRNISYEEANEVIHRFVTKCHNLLKEGKKLRFAEVGQISKNAEGHLEFEPDMRANYLEDTFGMTTLIAPPVIRTTRQEHFEEAFKKKTTIRKQHFIRLPKALKWVAIAIPFVAAGIWGVSNMDKIDNYYQQHADYFTPISGESSTYSSTEDQLNEKRAMLGELKTNQAGIFTPTFSDDNEEITYDNDVVSDEELNAIISTIEEVNVEDFELNIADEEIVVSEVLETYQNTPTAEFYVIVGAYGEEQAAIRFVNKLKKMGYPAEIAGKSASGLYRVSAIQAKNDNDAKNKLKIVRSEDFPTAWLLKL
ncbi:MAG: SPOR domain-containing protein [Bacteroidales bacterium]|nr:SPOR domain-containing protein [Bacteroidales bacterium]